MWFLACSHNNLNMHLLYIPFSYLSIWEGSAPKKNKSSKSCGGSMKLGRHYFPRHMLEYLWKKKLLKEYPYDRCKKNLIETMSTSEMWIENHIYNLRVTICWDLNFVKCLACHYLYIAYIVVHVYEIATDALGCKSPDGSSIETISREWHVMCVPVRAATAVLLQVYTRS
jgi:hypothetical protein